jgi:hypothetical protein
VSPFTSARWRCKGLKTEKKRQHREQSQKKKKQKKKEKEKKKESNQPRQGIGTLGSLYKHSVVTSVNQRNGDKIKAVVAVNSQRLFDISAAGHIVARD